MREVIVAISGLAAKQPGRAVARALREAFGDRVRFVGLSYHALEPCAYEPGLFERTYLMPFAYVDAEHIFDRLKKIKEDGGLDFIYPTLDTEFGPLSRLEEKLASIGVKAIIPTKEQLKARSKQHLPALAARAGLRVPKTRVCPSWDAVWRALPEMQYPFFVKGAYFEAYLVHNGHQLEGFVRDLANRWGYPVILQANVTGMELDVIALGDGTGKLLGCVPMKKLQLDVNNKAWGGITVDAPDLVELAGKVVEALKWRGVLELEVMRTEDDRLHLIEVNPRVPAWAYLAVAAGQNVIAGALALALGEEVTPMTEYTVGTMHLRQTIDVISPIGVYESLVMTGEARGLAAGDAGDPGGERGRGGSSR